MAKKLIDILSDAAVVRDETNEKANTAERVGGVLVELANYLSAFAPVSDVTVETDGSNVRLVLHLKNEDGTVSTRSVPLPAASTSSAGVLTSELLKALNAADRSNEDLAKEGISKAESASAMLFAEEAARKETDAELLKRIIGKSTASSAYNDPFRYLTDYQSEKDASGTITKHAIRVMQDALLDTLRHSDYRESFPYIGHMRAHIEGVPIEMWTYVKAWNTGSTNGVFVQVVRTNFGLKGGVISSALTSEFHEYHREVTVAMSDGNVTDVTATAWQESTVTDALLNQIQDHEDRIWKLENQWYGIEWDTEVSSPAVTRIGNMDLHRTLPIQSRMRGCLLDDNGKVTKYLNPKDWTGEVRDGSRGQVMVEIPMHYRRCETEETKLRVKLSEHPLPGFLPIPRMYLAAYEATLQRSTNKLCSVVNTTPDYRGGTNKAEFDGTHKSTLGKPINSLSLNNARTYARNRNGAEDTRWNCYAYDVHVTLTWLFVVEYATRNAQLPFTSELTSEGFHQGGIEGILSLSFKDFGNFFSYQPIIHCGHTDSLGNGTGIVPLHVETDDGAFSLDWNVPRYRGVEVPFGHLQLALDGILLARPNTSSAWTAYACSDPAEFNSGSVAKYRMIGTLPTTYGFVSDIHFGELGDITTASVGASSTSKFCDYYTFYSDSSTINAYYVGGKIVEGTECGLFYSGVAKSVDTPHAYDGTRLCFLPAE